MTDVVNSGAIEMAIGNEGGLVIQRFKEPMLEVRYEPENAINVAQAFTDNAFVCRDGVKPVGETLKAELVERHRMKLIQSIAFIFNSTREDRNKTNGALAKIVVDTCLTEIFS